MARKQLSYIQGISSTQLIGETIGDYFDTIVAEFDSTEALVSVFENQRYSYRELHAEVNRCARALMALGLKKGDRVGLWSTNCVAWTFIQFATAKIGAVLVNINPANRVQELEYALLQSECNCLISGERFRDADYVKMLRQLIPEMDGAASSGVVQSSRLPQLRSLVFLGGGRPEGMLHWSELLTWAERVTEEELTERQASLEFDDVINVQYTSGTTGFPKGAMLTHHNLLNNGFWIAERMRFTHRDRLCIPVPFYHCFGMVAANLACVTHGAVMVLPAPHFSPLHTLQAIAQERCTAVHGVPTMFIAELDHPQFRNFDLSSLRTGIMAGAPCPIEVMKRVISEMHCREITIACGMTEASPVCNMTEVDDPIEIRVGTVGRVMAHQEQKIIDPATRKTLPRGEHGELCYRGYQVMRGYYNDPKGTREAIDAAGWLHSGDLAVMDEQGYVKITGRLKDMICRGEIMDYKIPHHVKFVVEFPTTVTGKVQKFRMREISAVELKQTIDVGEKA